METRAEPGTCISFCSQPAVSPCWRTSPLCGSRSFHWSQLVSVLCVVCLTSPDSPLFPCILFILLLFPWAGMGHPEGGSPSPAEKVSHMPGNVISDEGQSEPQPIILAMTTEGRPGA